MDSARGSADGCWPDAGTPGSAVGVFCFNALLCPAEAPNDVEVADFLGLAASVSTLAVAGCGAPPAGEGVAATFWASADFGEEPDASVNPPGDVGAEDFGEEPDASVNPPGDVGAEDFGEEPAASVNPRGDFAPEDFGEESEGSADCDGELPGPVPCVSA